MQETAVDSTICSPYWRDANTASILTPCWIIGQQTIAERNVDGVEFRMKQTKMYVCTLEEFILVEIWIHCCTKSNWITLEECWFIYTRNKGMRYVRITLRCTIDTGDWIELQLHEKLSLMRTKLWSVIPLFASLIMPGGVNGNPCWHIAHQTAGGTIECHSCN